MKNVSRPLVTGYRNLLNNMVVDGKQIPFFYLRAKIGAKAPYVILTGITTFAKNTRDDFDGEATVDLSIYTEFNGDFGSMNPADDIADELLERVIPAPGTTNVQAEGFTVAGAKLVGSRDHESRTAAKVTLEKKITIEHLIYQL